MSRRVPRNFPEPPSKLSDDGKPGAKDGILLLGRHLAFAGQIPSSGLSSIHIFPPISLTVLRGTLDHTSHRLEPCPCPVAARSTPTQPKLLNHCRELGTQRTPKRCRLQLCRLRSLMCCLLVLALEHSLPSTGSGNKHLHEDETSLNLALDCASKA